MTRYNHILPAVLPEYKLQQYSRKTKFSYKIQKKNNGFPIKETYRRKHAMEA